CLVRESLRSQEHRAGQAEVRALCIPASRSENYNLAWKSSLHEAAGSYVWKTIPYPAMQWSQNCNFPAHPLATFLCPENNHPERSDAAFSLQFPAELTTCEKMLFSQRKKGLRSVQFSYLPGQSYLQYPTAVFP